MITPAQFEELKRLRERIQTTPESGRIRRLHQSLVNRGFAKIKSDMDQEDCCLIRTDGLVALAQEEARRERRAKLAPTAPRVKRYTLRKFTQPLLGHWTLVLYAFVDDAGEIAFVKKYHVVPPDFDVARMKFMPATAVEGLLTKREQATADRMAALAARMDPLKAEDITT